MKKYEKPKMQVTVFENESDIMVFASSNINTNFIFSDEATGINLNY